MTDYVITIIDVSIQKSSINIYWGVTDYVITIIDVSIRKSSINIYWDALCNL